MGRDGTGWVGMRLDGARWEGTRWDGTGLDETGLDGMGRNGTGQTLSLTQGLRGAPGEFTSGSDAATLAGVRLV